MKILFLGKSDSPVVDFIKSLGDEVVTTEEKIDSTWVQSLGVEFVVSFGYRHIIRTDVISLFPNKIINLHISYLPWNRGADPNFWSFFENTPKGVSIHCIDEGIDTGDLIAQRECTFAENDTLKTSYEKLQKTLIILFQERWPEIKKGNYQAVPQKGIGSVHRVKDKEQHSALIQELGNDTPIAKIISRKNSESR